MSNMIQCFLSASGLLSLKDMPFNKELEWTVTLSLILGDVTYRTSANSACRSQHTQLHCCHADFVKVAVACR